MVHHRNAAKITLKAQEYPILGRVKNDPTLKVMIFCAGENKGLQDVAFPHQSEIKVNTGAVTANLRGLKNKPGSTRPVDITKELRLSPSNYANIVEMTYALTNKVDGSSLQVGNQYPPTRCLLIHFALPFCAIVQSISC